MADPADPDARLAKLVHDLRSPLMVAEGFSQLLARDTGNLTAEQRADFAARIQIRPKDVHAHYEYTGVLDDRVLDVDLGDLQQVAVGRRRDLHRLVGEPALEVHGDERLGVRRRRVPEEARDLRGVATFATGIGPWYRHVDVSLVAAVHAQGLAIRPWTVNQPAAIEHLLALGVDGVITDVPDVAAALRRRVAATPVAA